MSMPKPKWDSNRQKEYQREYSRRRKADCKARGICPNCEKQSSEPGKVCCRQCLEDKKLTAKFGTAGPYRQLHAELFEKQRGLCGICKESMKRPVLDHSHTTMEVRGLLCSSCNIGLGQFKDSASRLQSALMYIQNNAGIGITMKKRRE